MDFFPRAAILYMPFREVETIFLTTLFGTYMPARASAGSGSKIFLEDIKNFDGEGISDPGAALDPTVSGNIMKVSVLQKIG